MPQLTPSELAVLTILSDEIREAFDDEGYCIDAAAHVHEAFDTGGTRSKLARGLIAQAAGESSGRLALDFRPVTGGGREVRLIRAGVDRRLRIRRAKRTLTGDFIVKVSSDSALAVDEQSLFAQENWVLGYTLNDTATEIIDIFAAHVTSFKEGSPGQLIFGQVVLLGSGGPSDGRFRGVDEDLPPFPGSGPSQDDVGFGRAS